MRACIFDHGAGYCPNRNYGFLILVNNPNYFAFGENAIFSDVRWRFREGKPMLRPSPVHHRTLKDTKVRDTA